jgi:hypothetical protein
VLIPYNRVQVCLKHRYSTDHECSAAAANRSTGGAPPSNGPSLFLDRFTKLLPKHQPQQTAGKSSRPPPSSSQVPKPSPSLRPPATQSASDNLGTTQPSRPFHVFTSSLVRIHRPPLSVRLGQSAEKLGVHATFEWQTDLIDRLNSSVGTYPEP